MAAAAAVGDGVGEGEGHDLGYPNATKSCPTPVNVAMTTTMTHQQPEQRHEKTFKLKNTNISPRSKRLK